MTTVPEQFQDLLTNPHIGALATVRPDGAPSVTPMWYLWEGDRLRFTHTTRRAKLHDLEATPYLSLLIIDPANGHRYLQVRGQIESIEPDPTGAFYVQLASRYGARQVPPADAADRVIIVARPIGLSHSVRG
jgi:PPOX class probable F420-dependent enzyme